MAILPNFTLRLEPELRDLVKAAVRYARQAGGRERLEEFLAGGQGEGHQALAGQVADLAERLARLEETKTLERQGFMDMAARLEPLEALAAGIDGTILAMIRRELETSKADAMQSALHQKTPQDALQGHVTAGDANTPGQPETTIQDAPQGQGEAKKPDTQARK
ncbi:MAG: hypothetical protein HQL87_09510, partial [Magnetococcales bacterium]|nr:hypothetical protein [Magnetococcales bacterium]